MDYLKAFIIGSSGLVIFPLLTNVTNDKRYNYSNEYAFVIPLYYGFMSILSTFISNKFQLKLQYSLLCVSVLSCLIIFLANHKLIDKYYITNKIDEEKTLFLVLQDIIRELITFNMIIFTLSKYFDKYSLLKIFIIGSSALSYYNTFYVVDKGPTVLAGGGHERNPVNYDFKDFAITEPFVQGLGLMIGLYIGTDIFKMNLFSSIMIYQVIVSSIIMTIIAQQLQLYKLSNEDWIRGYLYGLMKVGLLKGIVLYYLITNIK